MYCFGHVRSILSRCHLEELLGSAAKESSHLAAAGLLPEGVEPTAENIMAHGWPANVHIIGKDILRFHAVYWPAMLMAAGGRAGSVGG